MVQIKEYKKEMKKVLAEIRITPPGPHKRDLLRRYNKMRKELGYATMQLNNQN